MHKKTAALFEPVERTQIETAVVCRSKSGKHSAQCFQGISPDTLCLKRLFLELNSITEYPVTLRILHTVPKTEQIVYKPRLRLMGLKVLLYVSIAYYKHFYGFCQN